MWRVTEREAGNDLCDRMDAVVDRANAAEAKLKALLGLIRECRLADAHAARTGEEGRWDRALDALVRAERDMTHSGEQQAAREALRSIREGGA